MATSPASDKELATDDWTVRISLFVHLKTVAPMLARFLAIFWEVTFFYYVIHIYLIHLLAVATAFAMTGDLIRTPEIGLSLGGVYLVWLLVLGLLYPICCWFADLTSNGRGWWWSYV